MDKRGFKRKVYEKCLEIVKEKIATAQKAVELAQQAAIHEERSTAGDKYDTARAMSHINQDMYGKQLAEVLKLKKNLDQISADKILDEIVSGALVETSNGNYFIVSSIGALKIDDQQIMVISPVAPIAQKMLGKRVNDEVEFNKLKISILSIT